MGKKSILSLFGAGTAAILAGGGCSQRVCDANQESEAGTRCIAESGAPVAGDPGEPGMPRGLAMLLRPGLPAPKAIVCKGGVDAPCKVLYDSIFSFASQTWSDGTVMDESISRIAVMSGVEVAFCEHTNLGGSCKSYGPTTTGTWEDLTGTAANDTFSSVLIGDFQTPATIETTGWAKVRLSRSILAMSQKQLDQDHDGLVDSLEGLLANAFRPIAIFDGDENARLPHEPVTVFQVRPTAYRSPRLTLRIKLIFLFERDGGYGSGSNCDGSDSHDGDNDDAWLELVSDDFGVNWTLARMHLSFGDLEWPVNSTVRLQDDTHPEIYMSRGKHHLYFDTSYDSDHVYDMVYSHYTSWICKDDMDPDGAFVLSDLTSLEKVSGYFNNIGEPEASGHPSGYFVDELDSGIHAGTTQQFFPGKTIWGGERFYDVDPNLGKVLRFPLPWDLPELVAEAPQVVWTASTSEETSEFVPAQCPNDYLVTGVHCTGEFCDNVALRCTRPPVLEPHQAVWWTDWFSEETDRRQCDNGFVTGLECRGRWCDDIRLECSSFAVAKPKPESCVWTSSSISEEGGGTAVFSDHYVAGVRCGGDYCDNLSFLLCGDRPYEEPVVRTCRAGQKCCEHAQNGECLLCWPRANPCP